MFFSKDRISESAVHKSAPVCLHYVAFVKVNIRLKPDAAFHLLSSLSTCLFPCSGILSVFNPCFPVLLWQISKGFVVRASDVLKKCSTSDVRTDAESFHLLSCKFFFGRKTVGNQSNKEVFLLWVKTSQVVLPLQTKTTPERVWWNVKWAKERTWISVGASAYLGYVHDKIIIQRAMGLFHSLSNKRI